MARNERNQQRAMLEAARKHAGDRGSNESMEKESRYFCNLRGTPGFGQRLHGKPCGLSFHLLCLIVPAKSGCFLHPGGKHGMSRRLTAPAVHDYAAGDWKIGLLGYNCDIECGKDDHGWVQPICFQLRLRKEDARTCQDEINQHRDDEQSCRPDHVALLHAREDMLRMRVSRCVRRAKIGECWYSQIKNSSSATSHEYLQTDQMTQLELSQEMEEFSAEIESWIAANISEDNQVTAIIEDDDDDDDDYDDDDDDDDYDDDDDDEDDDEDEDDDDDDDVEDDDNDDDDIYDDGYDYDDDDDDYNYDDDNDDYDDDYNYDDYDDDNDDDDEDDEDEDEDEDDDDEDDDYDEYDDDDEDEDDDDVDDDDDDDEVEDDDDDEHLYMVKKEKFISFTFWTIYTGRGVYICVSAFIYGEGDRWPQ